MRILYLHQYFRTPRMTGGTRSFELARRLVSRGHQVHMVTSDQAASSPAIYQTNEDGIQVTWIPVAYSNRMGYAARLSAFTRFAVHASQFALSWRPDVIYATSTPLTIGIPAIIAARHWGVPMVFEVRDLWPEVPIALGALRNPLLIRLARMLERLCYSNSAHVVTLSPGMKAGVAKSGCIADDAITVIPNLTNPDFWQATVEDSRRVLRQMELPPDRKILLYAGTLGRVNDIGYLVNLAAELSSLGIDEYVILVVGDGIERERIEQEARRAGVLNRNFLMRGRVTKQLLPALLNAATLSLSTVADIPELYNNSANKFFDAISAGVPIAINYGGWQADLIAKEGIGVVLPRCPREAAIKVHAFISEPGSIQRASANARRVAPLFSADRAAANIEKILTDACKHGAAFLHRAGAT